MDINIQNGYLAREIAEERIRRLRRSPIQLEQPPKVSHLLKNLTKLFR